MNIEELIKTIESEQKRVKDELHSAEGMARLEAVARDYKGEYELISSREIEEEIKKLPEKKMHMCGVGSIDELTGGFREQMLISLAAHSGHGKTAMGLFLTEKYKELNPVFIALEQSAEELIEQRRANSQFVPFFYTNKTYAARIRPDWLESRVIEGIAKFNSKFIVIDHLGYTDPHERYDRDQEHLRIERKMQDIKNIAKRWSVIILVLVHIVQLDESQPPSLASLKGSSAIKQESDKVILLWRKNEIAKKIRLYHKETLFSVQKNRWSGTNGNVGLLFEPSTGKYLPEEKDGWVAQMEKMANQQSNQQSDADSQFDG